MTEPRITEAQVRHVARLARLSLGDDEVSAMQVQLARILDYVASLDALDVGDVPPTSHAVPLVAPLREDVVRPSLSREELLAQAPKTEAGAFAVPKVMEGEP